MEENEKPPQMEPGTTPSVSDAEEPKDQETVTSAESTESETITQVNEDVQQLAPEDLEPKPSARIELSTPMYQRNELTIDQYKGLNELERRHFVKLLKDPWYLTQPTKVQEMVKRMPPFNLYKILSTQHVCFITEYHEKKDDNDAPVVMTVAITPEYNAGNLTFVDSSGLALAVDKKIFGVPERDLQNVGLRSVFDSKRLLEEQAKLPFMQQIATRKGQLDKSKREQAAKRWEKGH